MYLDNLFESRKHGLRCSDRLQFGPWDNVDEILVGVHSHGHLKEQRVCLVDNTQYPEILNERKTRSICYQ